MPLHGERTTCPHFSKQEKRMSIRIAINGYGRIGRCVLRALYESGKREEMEIVAVNEPASLEAIAHLTQFDSTHGRFHGEVSHEDGFLVVNGDRIHCSREDDIRRCPWSRLNVDVALECSGKYTDRSSAEAHLQSGARKVIFSCPAARDVDATIVCGYNEDALSSEDTVISNASCTSNCITHIIDLLHERLHIENGIISTIHSMMNDQPVIDAYHNPDLRKNRSSGNSIIPVNTGLATGIDRLFPHLQGRFQAVSLRVPTMNVSAMQLTARTRLDADADAVNLIFRRAAEGPLAGILGYTELPLVSCDFTHDPRSAVVDGNQTSVSGGKLINIMAWFDNEWGYANRMLDAVSAVLRAR